MVSSVISCGSGDVIQSGGRRLEAAPAGGAGWVRRRLEGGAVVSCAGDVTDRRDGGSSAASRDGSGREPGRGGGGGRGGAGVRVGEGRGGVRSRVGVQCGAGWGGGSQGGAIRSRGGAGCSTERGGELGPGRGDREPGWVGAAWIRQGARGAGARGQHGSEWGGEAGAGVQPTVNNMPGTKEARQ